MNRYRAQLEAEKEKILYLLDNPRTEGKVHMTRRLREIVTALNEMDEGNNWSQEPGDTKTRIVIQDIHTSTTKKVFRS